MGELTGYTNPLAVPRKVIEPPVATTPVAAPAPSGLTGYTNPLAPPKPDPVVEPPGEPEFTGDMPVMQRLIKGVTGESRREFDYPELPQNIFIDDKLEAVQANSTIGAHGNPLAMSQMFSEQMPDVPVEFDSFGNPFVELLGAVDKSGQRQPKKFYLNRPGPSAGDIAETFIDVGSFVAGGRVGGRVGGPSLIGRTIGTGIGTGAASVAMDEIATIMGSEQGIDGKRAAIMGVLGAGGEVAIPMFGRFFKAIFGSKKMFAGGKLTEAGKETFRKANIDPEIVTPDFARIFLAEARGAVAPSEAAIAAEAKSLPVPVRLSKGDVSRDVTQQSFEEAAAAGARGEPAKNIMVPFREAQQADLRANLPAIQERLGGGAEAAVASARRPLSQSGDIIAPARPASENIRTVLESQYGRGQVIGDEIVEIKSLSGGVSSGEMAKVRELAKKISGEGGFIERIIVDESGNVVEGAHRFEALRLLGAKNAPVTRIGDSRAGFPVEQMRQAIKAASPSGIHRDQASQLIDHAINAIREEGSAAAALANTTIPGRFSQAYVAALKATRGQGGVVAEVGQGGGAAQMAVRAAAQRSKVAYGKAYDAAEAGKATLPADVIDMFGRESRKGLVDAGFDIGAMPAVTRRLADLKRAMKMPGGNVEIKIRAMSIWRKRIVKDIQNAERNAPAEAAALRQMKGDYDAFTEAAIDSALLKGDAGVIEAWSKAVGMRAEHGRLFGDNKIIEKLIREDVTAETAANYLLGAGNLGGQAEAATAVQAIKAIIGKDSPAFLALKEEAFLRLLKSQPGTVGRDMQPLFSGANFARSLNKAMRNSPTLMREIFSKEEISLLMRFRDTAVRATTKVRLAGNPSGTAHELARAMEAIIGRSGRLTNIIIARFGRKFAEESAGLEASAAIAKPVVPVPLFPPGLAGGFGAAAAEEAGYAEQLEDRLLPDQSSQ